MTETYALNTLAYDSTRCTGCGLCAVVCPHGVFEAPAPSDADPQVRRLGAPVRVAKLVRPEACMECGACQLNCPAGAIKVESGVGCAEAMIRAALSGRKEPTCGPDSCGGSAPKQREAEC